ncbi:hypothetical protein C8F04DRAFT_995438 [Mycena alexandri]|uniref:Uncharacterized protein n=1 Tax=Mycena alexandri TaxID=1745969 RepID=A0AAD6X9U9_9AGAR|nr:hypothetical protein C8F04DRAFT_995438 [Mycena alexandri]
MHSIFFLASLVLSVISLTRAAPASSDSREPARTNPATLVNLRVEGANSTIFEAPIITRGHNITTASGGTHHCDGTNLDANASPGATCTSALDDAAKLVKFGYDGTFDIEFDDFFITRIASSAETNTQFWGLLLDYEFTPVGGCQQEVKTGQSILWAFDAFNKAFFLKLAALSHTTKVGKPFTVTVTDGTSRVPIAGATVNVSGKGGESVISDENGVASIVFEYAGVYKLKAERSDSIRSNMVDVVVI